MRDRCRFCNAALPAREGRGRPPAYCSVGHRRAGGHEIQRQVRRIEKLQNLLDAAERSAALAYQSYERETRQKEVDLLTAQIEGATTRLVALLDSDDEDETPQTATIAVAPTTRRRRTS
ncbi:MAG: hypothetical protein H0V12_07195 [Chloroflexi bacterium]|nr:hypothetical protein [Chloroflexota bacterium]